MGSDTSRRLVTRDDEEGVPCPAPFQANQVRQHVRRLYLSATASELPVVAEDRGQHVRRAVQLSGHDEAALRRCGVAALRRGLGALDDLGDRAGAIALYQDFAHRVAHLLGVEPAVESQAAMRAVQTRLTTGR